MPERNTEILRDLKRAIYTKRRHTVVKHHAVVDASSENLALGVIGSLLYGSKSMAEIVLFDLEYRETDPNPRTRIVQLKVPLPVGCAVTSNDLAVQDSQPE
jgi:hypothetical protein